jgi:ribosomal protein S18 acetylase RimI-like enzyme
MHWTITRAHYTPADEDALWQMLFYAAQMAKDGVSDYLVAKTTPSVSPYLAGWGRDGDAGFIARDGQSVYGAVWVRHVTDATGTYYPLGTHKLAIAVHPTLQARGLGTTLMHCMCAHADQAGWCLSLSVRADNAAVRVYQRHGFVVEKTIINRVGTPSSLMLRHQAGCCHQSMSKESPQE